MRMAEAMTWRDFGTTLSVRVTSARLLLTRDLEPGIEIRLSVAPCQFHFLRLHRLFSAKPNMLYCYE